MNPSGSHKNSVGVPSGLAGVGAALRKITRHLDLQSRVILKKSGLTTAQLAILSQLPANGGAASVGEISRAVSLSEATVSGILARLAERGLITRQRDSMDRRRVMIRATHTGAALTASAPPCSERFSLIGSRTIRLPGNSP